MRFRHFMYGTVFVEKYMLYKTYSIHKVHLGSFRGVRAIQKLKFP